MFKLSFRMLWEAGMQALAEEVVAEPRLSLRLEEVVAALPSCCPARSHAGKLEAF